MDEAVCRRSSRDPSTRGGMLICFRSAAVSRGALEALLHIDSRAAQTISHRSVERGISLFDRGGIPGKQ